MPIGMRMVSSIVPVLAGEMVAAEAVAHNGRVIPTADGRMLWGLPIHDRHT